MATPRTYSYHRQLLLLTQAIEAMKVACSRLEDAHGNEVVQLGPEDASAGEYNALAMMADDLQGRLQDHAAAVKALAEMTPPDPVPPHDPTDFSEDPRFQRMIDDAHDMTAQYALDPSDVGKALVAAVGEGDQR